MTAQISDRITWKGKEYLLMMEPLASYLENLPDIKFQYRSTSCYRGYKSEWEIVGEMLWLLSLEGSLKNGQEADLITLFPVCEGKVFAKWFSGELRLAKGEMLAYVHGGYMSVYEEDIFIAVKNGYITGVKVVSNQEKALEIRRQQAQMEPIVRKKRK